MDKNRRVLVVDYQEYKHTLMIVEEILGCKIDVVETPVCAIEAMTNTQYGVVVVEPFRGRENTDTNPVLSFMRYLNEQGVPFIISSTKMPEELERLYGITQGLIHT